LLRERFVCTLARSSACGESAHTLMLIYFMILTTWGFQCIHSVTSHMAFMSDEMIGFQQKFEF